MPAEHLCVNVQQRANNKFLSLEGKHCNKMKKQGRESSRGYGHHGVNISLDAIDGLLEVNYL